MLTEQLGHADTSGPDDLRALLAELPGLPLASWPDVLRDVRLGRIAGHLRFDHERYTRSLVACTPDAEMLVMGWLPDQRSAIHDHGASSGVTMVLAGEGVEESFELHGARPVRVSARELAPGTVLEETPGGIHRVANPGPGLLVTLHVYGPRLADFRTYEP